jgi:hypothetical protein
LANGALVVPKMGFQARSSIEGGLLGAAVTTMAAAARMVATS